jgi:GNAT superfamily N-acetyltransferase
MPALSHRRAKSADIAGIQDVEPDAGQRFKHIGMPEIAHDPPLATELLAELVRDEHVWVTEADGDQIVAYLIAIEIDGDVHIDQVSVRTKFERIGIGAALIELAAEWGKGIGARRVTLFTFEEVAWNAPYYRRLGFIALDDSAMGPELLQIFEAELATDLHHWRRVALARTLI